MEEGSRSVNRILKPGVGQPGKLGMENYPERIAARIRRSGEEIQRERTERYGRPVEAPIYQQIPFVNPPKSRKKSSGLSQHWSAKWRSPNGQKT
jgi:hypothetical protein